MYHIRMYKDKCLYPMCVDREVRARGLCHNHYVAAGRLVKKGLTTWDDLERAGKCKNRQPHRRGPGEASKWFLEADQPSPAK